ncbi:MAG: ribosome small subunit-dependent GTPase A [Bacteroidetes bacterium]|nr:ribosome small subunit-dependent GTPase A [Bacteroidota bacterium]MBS1590686.1 ribosome small subunit-dependent GTPase A [Bacteroidota bacterium]
MKALIYKSTGSWYWAKTVDGKTFQCRVKGIFKIDAITSTNPIAVGDIVEIELENEDGNIATIISIDERKNYVARQSPHNKYQHHIIASNLNQSILFATLKDPKTSQGFIDRFLVACEMYHVPAIIVFNKADIYRKKEMLLFNEMKLMYENIGYKVLLTSIINKEGIDEIKNLLHNKISLLSGHSGVGKSSFINIIFPELDLKTLEVSNWSGKGMHSTTFAEMFDLPFEGKIIDTPGIRELGLVDIDKQELSHYFPEMRMLLNNCKYNNCLHINEPDCAIKTAAEKGIINMERYISYCKILDTIDENKY